MSYDPSLEECEDFLDWIEANNSIDLNEVRFRIREVEGTENLIVYLEWTGRSKTDRPKSSELLVKPGWVMGTWFWTGGGWGTAFWQDPD